MSKKQQRAALKPRNAADAAQTATTGAQAPDVVSVGAQVASQPENATQADPGTASETGLTSKPADPVAEPDKAPPVADDTGAQAPDKPAEAQPPAEAPKPVVGAVSSEQAQLAQEASVVATAAAAKQAMGQNVNDFTSMMESIDPAAVDQVIVESPKAFRITLDNHAVVHIKPGTQRVPRYIAEHWYAKANGMTIFKG
jgi:hypothetical protein